MGEGSVVGCFDWLVHSLRLGLMKLGQFLDHCRAYLVSIVFHFSLEGRTMVLIVTVPLSLQIFNFT